MALDASARIVSPAGPEYQLNAFLGSLAERPVSAHTIKAYRHDVIKFIESCGGNLCSITAQGVQQYLGDLEESGAKLSTVKRALSAVREFLGFLVDLGDIKHNPAAQVRVMLLNRQVISPGQIVSFLRYLAEHQASANKLESLRYRRDELILRLMIFFGVRQYQIPLLKLSAIEQNAEVLTIRVNKEMLLTLSPGMISRLRLYLTLRTSNSDKIFLDPLDNKPVSSVSVLSLIRELNYRFGTHCSAHMLFHTFLYLRHNPREMDDIMIRSRSGEDTFVAPTGEQPGVWMTYA